MIVKIEIPDEKVKPLLDRFGFTGFITLGWEISDKVQSEEDFLSQKIANWIDSQATEHILANVIKIATKETLDSLKGKEVKKGE